MKEYKTHQVAIIVAFSVFSNFLGRLFSDILQLPVWLDSFGTFFTAYVLGPACAVMVGASCNIFYALFFPKYIFFVLPSVCIALIVGYFSRKGSFETMLQTMSLSVLVTIVCVITQTVLNIFVFDGKINNIWGDGIVSLLKSRGVFFPICVLVGQFYVDFVDKVITLGALFYFIRIYRALKQRLPRFLKMNIIVFSIVLGAFFVIPSTVFAEEKNFNSYVRTVYNGLNGIPSGEVNDIVSTNDGIMWIGSYAGLYRHNGTEFRFMHEFDSIRSVKCLYVDDEGRLFVGTNDNGLSIVINETVMNVLEEKNGLPADSVRCITRSSDGFYYVGTAGEMAVISINGGLEVAAVISEIESAKKITADDSDRVATVTSGGTLFIVQDKKIVWDSKSTGEHFTTAAFGTDGLLYAATEKNTLLVFELSGNPVRIVEAVHSMDCGSLRHINAINFVDDCIFLCADNGAGYLHNGAFYLIETGDFNNSIDHLTIDYQGNFWFSSSRLGLLKMCESEFSDVYSAAGFENAVVNATLKYHGDLYFATDSGLLMSSAETGQKSENELTRLLLNTRVRCLTEDKNGVMWICTKSKGILSFDGKTIKLFGEGKNFRVAIPLSDGSIAAGTNDGLCFIKDDTIVETPEIQDMNDHFENPTVLCLTELPNGKIMAGTDGGGLVVIKKNKAQNWEIERLFKRGNGLSSNVILRIIPDRASEKNSVFVVTSNAICYIDIENFVSGQDLELFSVRILNNFPYYNNYDLVIHGNDIFVLGSAGIFVVNRDELLSGKERVDFELLDLKKGLRSALTANSWNYLDENGNLFLSCGTGASCFNLNNYGKNDRSYRMQLKSLLVDGKRHILQKDISFVIPAECETVEIAPEIINYSINNPYISVWLEGVDEKPYILPQRDLTSSIYTNLKSGTYHFHLAVLDAKGHKITEESIYSLTKAHRFYDNWWFMLYAVGVFVLAVAWLTWYSTSMILKRRMEQQEKEMQVIKNQMRMGNETIFAIANAVEARDKSTGRHSFRVAEYSVLIARELGFSEEELEGIRKTGLLHDIGKIGVPDSILNKPAKLTDEEYAIMKTHVNIGGEILKDFTLIENVADGAKYHHEHFDGSGYPNHLRGEEIPLNARIIGIADAFDAMTANRIYRKALDMDFVVSELKRCAGTQFDPALAAIMVELIESGKLDVHNVFNKSASVS